MGNTSSSVIESEIDHSEKKCLICWDKIVENIDYVVCIRCNIKLHAYCEQTYRGEKGHCKCPHCQQVGTLGIV